MNVSTRVLRFVEAPMDALLDTSTLPPTMTVDSARFTFWLRQRLPATYMRDEPVMLFGRLWSHALPV